MKRDSERSGCRCVTSVLILVGIVGQPVQLAAQTATQPATPGQTATPAGSVAGRGAGKGPQIDSPGATLPGSKGAAQGLGASMPGQPGVPTFAQPGSEITLDEALQLARSNEPSFVAAYAASRSAELDRSIARAALLPSAVYHNQFLYTQPNEAFHQTGATVTPDGPRFVANNEIHEYVSQGVVTETIGFAQYNALTRAAAASAIANAELEISRRGLTSTVLSLFYAYSISQRRILIQRRALDEAADFVKQTEQREAARESAHADVIKAQLTLQQRQRDFADTQLAAEKARLELGVLLFADPRSPYTVVLPQSSPLPTRAQIEAAAATNPELTSAFAALRSRNLEIGAARAAYLPDLSLAYSYGIDAPQFASNGPDGVRFRGYSASATLDIPLWDWLATEHRIKQAQILRDAAKVSLSATQRQLIAQLEEFYGEATLAHGQLDSLELSVQTARESLRLTRLRYTAGESTVLEVVDAQNSLTAAELALQDGTVRFQTALANLQLLTGTI